MEEFLISNWQYVLIGLFFGVVLYTLLLVRYKSRLTISQRALRETNQRLELLSAEIQSEKQLKQQVQDKAHALEVRLKVRENELNHFEIQRQQAKGEREEDRARLKDEFELLSNRLLEEKGGRLMESNRTELNAILKPFKERIKDLQLKIEATHISTSKDHSSLLFQIKQLSQVHEQLSLDARNLTSALKYDAKSQGNWGEMVLQKVLESSNLREGEEYVMQHSTTDENHKRIQPDFVINLPDGKHLIIDSKVSLKAYEAYNATENEAEKSLHLTKHLISVKRHVRELNEKSYQNGKGFRAPDFVLMFMPIEASFALAVQQDKEIFTFAWDKKVVIVSPSTLLATLRTVASLWQQDRQNKNAQEIAKQAGALYAKFNGFVEDVKRIGLHVKKTEESYLEALKKLSTGKDNLVRKVERLRLLGAEVKESKIIDQESLQSDLHEKF